MARHRRVDAPEPAPSSPREVAAAASVASFALSARPPRKTRDPVALARQEMDAMAESGDWSAAHGGHLVALYEWLHAEVYGVATSELAVRRQRAVAASVAGAMVKREFAGDYGEAVRFMKWAWEREQEREEWRRANGRSGQRVGWRLQFGGALVTDWRLDEARRSAQ